MSANPVHVLLVGILLGVAIGAIGAHLLGCRRRLERWLDVEHARLEIAHRRAAGAAHFDGTLGD